MHCRLLHNVIVRARYFLNTRQTAHAGALIYDLLTRQLTYGLTRVYCVPTHVPLYFNADNNVFKY